MYLVVIYTIGGQRFEVEEHMSKQDSLEAAKKIYDKLVGNDKER